MSDITLISTRDLVEELLDRFDHAVFAGIKVVSTKEVSPIQTFRRWVGNSYTCSGICAGLNQTILKDFSDREEPIPGSDL